MLMDSIMITTEKKVYELEMVVFYLLDEENFVYLVDVDHDDRSSMQYEHELLTIYHLMVFSMKLMMVLSLLLMMMMNSCLFYC